MDDIESITFFGIFVSVVFSFLVSMADSFLKGLDKNQVIEVAEAGGDKYETLYTLLSQPQKYHVALALLKWLSIVSALALSFPHLISLPKIVPPIVIILVFVLLVEVVPIYTATGLLATFSNYFTNDLSISVFDTSFRW